MQTNWTDLLDQAGKANEVPPPGRYLCTCETAENVISQSGKLMFKLRWRITDGASKGAALFDNLVLTPDNPNALSFFFEKIRAIGLDPATFAQFTNEQIAQLFIGRSAWVTISHREWKGKTQADVDKYEPVDGAGGAGVPGVPTPPAPTQPPAQAPVPAPQPVPQPVVPEGQPVPVAPGPPAPPQAPWQS